MLAGGGATEAGGGAGPTAGAAIVAPRSAAGVGAGATAAGGARVSATTGTSRARVARRRSVTTSDAVTVIPVCRSHPAPHAVAAASASAVPNSSALA